MEVLIAWILLAVIVGWFAATKGHSGIGMFFVAILLSPLIGFIIEAIRKPNVAVTEKAAIDSGAMKKCPACAEMIRAEAIKCRYCGEAVPAAVSPEEMKGW